MTFHGTSVPSCLSPVEASPTKVERKDLGKVLSSPHLFPVATAPEGSP